MAKKPTIRERNLAKLDLLIDQKVSGSNGFLNRDMKRFIAEELVNAANNHNKLLTKDDTLQKRYDQYQKFYDKLFTTGMTGHALFSGTIEAKAERDIKKGIDYYIRENGKEKKVTHAELSYKIELLSHKLSTQHDIAFVKFKPIYFMEGKGKYRIVINIPKIPEGEFEEMTVSDIADWFDAENLEVIISDPSKIKNMIERKERDEKVKKRQKKIKDAKEYYYKKWKSE